MKSPTASSSLSTPSSRAYSASRVPITNGILSVIALFLSWILYQAYTYDNAQSGAWGCEMSWMTPSYRMIDWKDNPVPRYTLHLYRELGWDNDGQVTGHPVLFIPGNAGSYQQVRSIASSAARQYYGEPGGKAAHGMQSMRSIDLFTADLNEEFSAFHAPTLREQARFIASCIHKIFAQYRHLPPADRPTKITLLGHSMGGIVARLAVTSQTVSAIDAILTMSTPHAIPPLTLDSDMDSIYRTINKGQNKNDDHPTLISLCGGVSDTQIVSDSCGVLPSFVSDGFAAFTTNMPHVWTGVDHQAMVWCHQVRWRVARTLLEMTRSVSRHDKLQTAKQWLLLDNNAAASASADVLSEIERIIPVTSRSMTILLSETVGASYRVQHCESGGRCRIQTPVQEYLPLPANKTAPFPLSGEGIKAGESLIAVKVDLESEHGYLLLHSSSTLDRLDHGSRSQVNVSGSAWTSQSQANNNVTHRFLHFQDLRASSLIVHRVQLQTGQCDGPPPIIKHVTIPSRQTSHEARYFPHYDNPQVIRIHSHISSAPFISGHADSMGIQLELFQSTDCPVTTVKISVEWLGTLAKIVTRYRMTVVAWTIGWAAIVMLKQMSILRQTDRLVGFGASLNEVARGSWLLKVLALLGAAALAQKVVVISRHSSAAPLLLGTVDLLHLPVMVFLALWTFGLVCVLWNVTCTGLWIGTQLSTVAYLRSSPSSLSSSSQHTHRLVSLAPALLATLLVYFLVPNQLAFMIVIGVLWASICIQTEDKASMTPEQRPLAVSALFLMLLMSPFNIPSLFVWARSLWFKWGHSFATDHNVLSVLPGILIASMSLQHDGFRPNRRAIPTQLCRASLLVLAVASFTLGSRWTWVLPPVCHTVLGMMVATVW